MRVRNSVIQRREASLRISYPFAGAEKRRLQALRPSVRGRWLVSDQISYRAYERTHPRQPAVVYTFEEDDE